MVEILVELLASAVWDIIFQVVFEVLVECGFESLTNLCRPGRRIHPVLAVSGWMFLGGLVGLTFALLVPHRLIPISRFPGSSLVLAPLGAGLAMHLFGSWRRKQGGKPTSLATFWGGAAFAFGMALVRWLMVGRI